MDIGPGRVLWSRVSSSEFRVDAKPKTRNPKLNKSPFPSHPPFDAEQHEHDGEGPERAPQLGLALLDQLRRRDGFEFGGNLL